MTKLEKITERQQDLLWCLSKTIQDNPRNELAYKVYIGYRYYCDASHMEKAGGPLEIEIGKKNLN